MVLCQVLGPKGANCSKQRKTPKQQGPTQPRKQKELGTQPVCEEKVFVASRDEAYQRHLALVFEKGYDGGHVESNVGASYHIKVYRSPEPGSPFVLIVAAA